MDIKIIKSNRKTLSLSVDDDMCAVVKAPYFVTNREIDAFVSKNEAWLENAIERKKKKFEKYDISDDEKNRLINLAKEYLPGRVDYYSRLMNVKPTGIKITSAKNVLGLAAVKIQFVFHII